MPKENFFKETPKENSSENTIPKEAKIIPISKTRKHKTIEPIFSTTNQTESLQEEEKKYYVPLETYREASKIGIKMLSELEKNTPNNKEDFYRESSDQEIRNAIKAVNYATKIKSPFLGKIIYHDFKIIKPKTGKEFVNQIPNHLAYSTTKELGYDTYVSYNKEKGNFYIETGNLEALNKISEELNKLNKSQNLEMPLNKNGSVLFGKIGDLTEEEFIAILKGEKVLNENERKIQANNERIKFLKERIARREEEIEKLGKVLSNLNNEKDSLKNTEEGNDKIHK